MGGRFEVGSKIRCVTAGRYYNATGIVVGLRTGFIVVEFDGGQRAYLQPHEARTS